MTTRRRDWTPKSRRCRPSSTPSKEGAHEESQAQYYDSLCSIEKVKAQRVSDEREKRSVQRVMPDGSVVRTYQELYANKLTIQQHSSEQLRRQKAAIEKNEGSSMKQRAMFSDLYKLLECKHALNSDGAFGGANAFGSSEFELGGANVMKITGLQGA